MEIQKTKEDKYFKIFNYFYFMCAINLRDNCKTICSKTKTCPLNITFLYKFLYRVISISMKSFLLLEKSEIINMYKKKYLKNKNENVPQIQNARSFSKNVTKSFVENLSNKYREVVLGNKKLMIDL